MALASLSMQLHSVQRESNKWTIEPCDCVVRRYGMGYRVLDAFIKFR